MGKFSFDTTERCFDSHKLLFAFLRMFSIVLTTQVLKKRMYYED